MTNPKPPAPRSAGAFIAFGLLGGAGAGIYAHQPSIGLLAGFALGCVIAIFVWLRDRRR